MNKILIGLTLAIGLAIGGYALISKLYETLHENATLKANNQTLLEANQTNQITIDKLNALTVKIDDLNIALKQMAKEQDQNTEIAIEAIQPLKSKGGEYEILNAKYPDDPIINCVFKPSTAGCNPDGSRKTSITQVSN